MVGILLRYPTFLLSMIPVQLHIQIVERMDGYRGGPGVFPHFRLNFSFVLHVGIKLLCCKTLSGMAFRGEPGWDFW